MKTCLDPDMQSVLEEITARNMAIAMDINMPETRAEARRQRQQIIRGRLAFLIANIPAHEARPLDDLLRIVDAIMSEFQVARRRGRGR